MDIIIGAHMLQDVVMDDEQQQQQQAEKKEKNDASTKAVAQQEEGKLVELDGDGSAAAVMGEGGELGNWLHIVDEEVRKQEEEEAETLKKKATDDVEEMQRSAKKAGAPKDVAPQCSCKLAAVAAATAPKTVPLTLHIPLLDYLCREYKCSARELDVVFQNLERRRSIINHLRGGGVQLRTNHLRPFVRNQPVRCNDLTTQSANEVPAYRGYLGITVRAHYYIKHGMRLRHPHLPCVVEFGGADHKSFYPLEVLSVIVKQH